MVNVQTHSHTNTTHGFLKFTLFVTFEHIWQLKPLRAWNWRSIEGTTRTPTVHSLMKLILWGETNPIGWVFTSWTGEELKAPQRLQESLASFLHSITWRQPVCPWLCSSVSFWLWRQPSWIDAAQNKEQEKIAAGLWSRRARTQRTGKLSSKMLKTWTESLNICAQGQKTVRYLLKSWDLVGFDGSIQDEGGSKAKDVSQ